MEPFPEGKQTIRGFPSVELGGAKLGAQSGGSRRDLGGVSVRKRGTATTTRVYAVQGTTPRAFDTSLFLELNGDVYALDSEASGALTDRSSFLKKNTFMSFLLKMAAGRHWMSSRRALRLWPLRFESVKLEREYLASRRATMYFDGMVAQLVVLCGALAFIITSIQATISHWLPQEPIRWVVAEFLCQSLVLACLLGPIVFLHRRSWQIHYEASYYWFTGLALTVVFWMDVIIWVNESRITSLLFLPALMWHVPYQFFSILASVISVNMVINTRSRISFYFHVALIISYLLSRSSGLEGSEQRMGALAAAKGMGIAFLVIVAFAGRYFRELSDRASVVERSEALSKVERVRALVRSRTSEGVSGGGRVQSPAERLLEMLGQVMLTCKLVKDEDYGAEISKKFDDTTQILHQVIESLTSHEALTDLESTLAAAAGAGGGDGADDDVERAVVFAFANPALRGPGGARRTRIGMSRELMGSGAMSLLGDRIIQTPDIPCRTIELSLEEDEAGKIGEDLNFDLTSLSLGDTPMLIEVSMALCRPVIPQLGKLMSEMKVAQLFWSIKNLTFQNPYSNASRAAISTHLFFSTLKLVNVLPELDPLERLAFVVSSASRCLGNPGVGQQFLAMTNSRLSLLLNDDRVLENYACFILFRLLLLPGADVFSGLATERYRDIRKLIISFILSVNYAAHFELLSQFRLRRVSPEFDIKNDPEDRWSAHCQ